VTDIKATKVTILGLGTMGAGMASNLLKAGIPLTVYNRTQAKAQPFADKGARVAATPADAVKGASIVLSMLADDNASRDTWLGKDGALAAMESNAILIESSTVSPAWITELSAQAQQRGNELLDAPVTGSRTQSEGGQLSFLVGGSAAALATVTPVLNAMSKEIVHLGPIGSGAKMKLINNFLCGIQTASLAEALVWIERSGLDRDKALTILKSGAPGSPLLGAMSTRMTNRDYTINFLLRLLSKDMLYAGKEAASCNVDLKTGEAARGLMEAAIAEGYGEQDMSSLVEPLRKKK